MATVIDIVTVCAVACFVVFVFGYGLYSIWAQRKVEKENDRRLAEWRAACETAKRKGKLPPFPPNRAVRHL